ncbi:hypothetical protein BpHYR1_014546 [Brachionus plicatilis]|uniref:Uncharacterized protein n=1 Tax=Brachionus plicatilis TaxID=10195 RepID=A0A3M7PTL1_BRAPC|nr:hypothetical protein BpHYR1_014546 [Brachionus plicatilis]
MMKFGGHGVVKNNLVLLSLVNLLRLELYYNACFLFFFLQFSACSIVADPYNDHAKARLACGGVLHERSPMNKKIERINNKIVCGAYGTVVWVQDRKASYRFLNWFTEVALTTEAGRAFHSLTTLFVKNSKLCKNSAMNCIRRFDKWISVTRNHYSEKHEKMLLQYMVLRIFF